MSRYDELLALKPQIEALPDGEREEKLRALSIELDWAAYSDANHEHWRNEALEKQPPILRPMTEIILDAMEKKLEEMNQLFAQDYRKVFLGE